MDKSNFKVDPKASKEEQARQRERKMEALQKTSQKVWKVQFDGVWEKGQIIQKQEPK